MALLALKHPLRMRGMRPLVVGRMSLLVYPRVLPSLRYVTSTPPPPSEIPEKDATPGPSDPKDLKATEEEKYAANEKEKVTDAHVPEGFDEAEPEAPERIHASFYVSNVMPIKLGRFDPRPAIARLREDDLMEQLAAIAEELKGRHAFKVESYEVTVKDGGVLCHFSYLQPKLEDLPRKAIIQDFAMPDDQVPDPTSAASLFLPLLVDAAHKRGGWPSWLGLWWSNFIGGGATKAGRTIQEAGHHMYRGDQVDFTNSDQLHLSGWQRIAGAGRVWMVRGRQWTEDMNRFPSSRLRVEFNGPDVSQEMLYTLFRPYGRINDIEPPTPVPSGALRFAQLSYTRLSPSVTASNCLHGYMTATNMNDYHTLRQGAKEARDALSLTRLRIYYQDPLKAHVIRDWISAHPRLALPVLAFLIGTLSYTFFDPIREFFVRSQIEGIWDVEKYALVKVIRDKIYLPLKNTFNSTGLLRRKRKSVDEELGRASWRDRLDAEQSVERWLSEFPSTFIVVTGPPGSGKHNLVDRVIQQEKKPSLIIDCAEISKSKTDAMLVSSLANQTGYWPVFSFLQSLNGLIDLAAVGLIGQKAGFSTPVNEQLRYMLDVVASALKDVSLHNKEYREREAETRKDQIELAALREHESELVVRGVWHDGRLDCVAGNGIMSELGMGIEPISPNDFEEAPIPMMDATAPIEGEGAPPTAQSLYFDKAAAIIAALSIPEEEVSTQEPELDTDAEMIKTLPIVVLRNFAQRPARGDLWTVMAEWGASLVENRIAHVIIVGEGSITNKTLTAALPSKPLNQVVLADADVYNSLEFVREKLSHPDKPVKLSSADEEDIAKLGGRMVDLEILVYKVRGGQSIPDAVSDIVQRNVVEIRKSAFGDDSEDAKHLPWTRPQAWKIVTLLADKNKVSVAKLLQEFPFKGSDTALKAMEEHDLITISYDDGRATFLRPGKPVFREAFKRLVDDKVFHASSQIEFNAAVTKKAEAEISVIEEELRRLKEITSEGDKLNVGEPGWFGMTKGSPIYQRAQYLLNELGKRMDKVNSSDTNTAEQMKAFATDGK